MKSIAEDVKRECVRLRVEEGMSLSAISVQTGVSKGTLSVLLRLHPQPKLRKRRAWNKGTRKYNPEESKWHRLAREATLGSNGFSKLAEAAVLFRMCACGISVWGSPFDGEKADWLAQVGDKIFKVQVKLTSKGRHGYPSVNVRSSSAMKPYSDGEVDFLVGYDAYTDTAYVYSWEEIRGRKACVSISEENKERWDKITGA